MIKTINININGKCMINFGDEAIEVDIGSPELPSNIGKILEDIYDDMSSNGISETHLEHNHLKSFRHDVKAGVVTETNMTPLEGFNIVMNAKDEIFSALSESEI